MSSTSNLVRIGISGSYGGMNLGDEGILESIIAQLRADCVAEITVFSRDAADTAARHDVQRAIPVRDLSRSEARDEIARLDAFILGGGGILYDAEAEIYLRELTLAHELGIGAMVYAIGAGPLDDPAVRAAVREALGHAAVVVSVRDRQTQRLLEEIGVQREIHLTADPALLLAVEPVPADVLERDGIDVTHRLIGFSVREPGPAAPTIDVNHYHALLANAADFIVDRLDADVVFVPVERRRMDMQHCHAVVARMQEAERATVLKGDYSSRQLIDLIGHFEFSVGMRLHFLIFCALAGVPFVPLPYASKVAGLIEDLGMEMPLVHDVNSGRLIAIIDRSWDLRADSRERIQRSLPALQQRARHTHRLLLDLLASCGALPRSRRRRAG